MIGASFDEAAKLDGALEGSTCHGRGTDGCEEAAVKGTAGEKKDARVCRMIPGISTRKVRAAVSSRFSMGKERAAARRALDGGVLL